MLRSSRRTAFQDRCTHASHKKHLGGREVRRLLEACASPLLLLLLVLGAPSCGGGGGEAPGRALTLVGFSLNDIDNVPINRRLALSFSAAVDPASVDAGSIQIREGDAFGRTVRGTFKVEGAEVEFLPELPVSCDWGAADYEGLHPNTEYMVTVVGFPEAFAVRGQSTGKAMSETQSFRFRTCEESDPRVLEDMIPGRPPKVLSTSHEDGSVAALVHDDNAVRIAFSEGLDPCSVREDTVRFRVHEFGDRETRVAVEGGRFSGFEPAEDNSPNPYAWGSTAPTTHLAAPQRIPATIRLSQDLFSTEVVITPVGGHFPENALIVIELTAEIRDFGGSPLTSNTIAFTSENLPAQERHRLLEFAGETPILYEATTADVDTGRSPGLAQGWFAFAGDGDNGRDPTNPAGPLPGIGQANDSILDHFDPISSVVFDTGSEVNVSPNDVDGSRAVVWEFQSLRLRAGVVLRFIGENPAILLVRGDATIEAGAKVLVRGDRQGLIPPIGDGERWQWVNRGATLPVTSHGGVGVAGGGDGGSSICSSFVYGHDGVAGVGSSEAREVSGYGAGWGGVALRKDAEPTNGGCAGAGGGGAHAREGEDGLTDTSPYAEFKAEPRSDGGSRYWAGPSKTRMLQPSAGSGGGGGGWLDHFRSGTGNGPSGGGGGAGGGYLAIVCAGDLTVAGTIDASGGEGGRAMGIWSGRQYLARGGGGGGGAGGGILLMTPNELRLSTSSVLTTAGGAGGLTGTAQPPPPYNHGGGGSNGRLVMEDGDGIIHGSSGATLVPGEGSVGYYRGVFEEERFVGGRRTHAVTEPFYVGSLRPTYVRPAPQDLLAGVPLEGAPGSGTTAILVEVRGYAILPDGTLDKASASPWRTTGYFETSFDPKAPNWHEGSEPPDIARPVGNAGPDLTSLNVPQGMPFLQVRLSFFLAEDAGAADAGAYLDRWKIRFIEDF